MNKLKEMIKNSKVLQFALVFVSGIVIGALFYPSKTIIKEVKVEDTSKIERLSEEKHQMESKHTSELQTLENSSRQKEQEFKLTVNKLSTQVSDLKSKQKTSYYKIVKPDGTVEIKKFSESEVSESTKVVTEIRQEFDIKVRDIENRWKSVHEKRTAELKESHDSKVKEYEEKIHKLEQYEKIEINKKTTGLEVGYLNTGNYYGHVDRELFGPLFLGAQAQFGPSKAAFGAGIGLRW